MLGIGLLLRARKLKRYDSASSRRWKGLLRVAGYAAFVMAGVGVVSFRTAKADMGKSSLAFGHDLAGMADVMQETTHIQLNGEDVFVSSAITQSQTVSAVLDRFDAHCRANAGAMGAAWSELAKAGAKEGAKGNDVLGLSVIHTEKNGEGAVVCLTRGTKTGRTFGEAARDFVQTRDLGTLGKLRYAFARKTTQGNTQVLTAWTEDSFNFDKIIPRDGSEPGGADSKEISRPPGGKRVMSAEIVGTPFGARVYRSSSEPAQVMTYYDAEMDTRGWLIIDPPEAEGKHHAYLKDGVQIVVSTGKDDMGTIVSIGELAAVDKP